MKSRLTVSDILILEALTIVEGRYVMDTDV